MRKDCIANKFKDFALKQLHFTYFHYPKYVFFHYLVCNNCQLFSFKVKTSINSKREAIGYKCEELIAKIPCEKDGGHCGHAERSVEIR